MRRPRLVVLLVLAACDPPIGRSTFSEVIHVGPGPIDVAAGDLDGDGRTDLVTVIADGTLVIRLYRNGQWRAPPGEAPRAHAHMVGLGDVDADGRLDIVTTDHDSGDVTLFRGTGGGRFGAAETVRAVTAEKPHNHGLVVADLDRDGDADVVVADQVAKLVVVLISNGGALEPRAPIALPAEPYPPAAGDLDGDGRIDLVVPLVGDRAVVVLLGTAAGDLGAPRTFATTRARPYGAVVGDVDGDGLADVVVSHDDTDTVVVMAGNGRGELVEARAIELPARIFTPVLLDVDGDGSLDLVGAGSGQLIIAARGLSTIRTEALGGWRLIAAALDDDRRLDLAAPDQDAGVVRIWRAK
jgi:hypothetical protein